MVLVFDLDDTLYDEESYVLSGFKSVSKYLEYTYGIDRRESFSLMVNDFKANGRGKIFNNILENYSIFSKKKLKKIISIYRQHIPNIKLFKDSINILEKYSKVPKYVVTDGNKIVQDIKCRALNLDKYMKKIFITYRYGIKNAKPNTYCFHKILKMEKTGPENVIYIADNPNKDFINLNKEGFHTVRIMRGMFANKKVKKEFDGKHKINSLNEITSGFIKSINVT